MKKLMLLVIATSCCASLSYAQGAIGHILSSVAKGEPSTARMTSELFQYSLHASKSTPVDLLLARDALQKSRNDEEAQAIIRIVAAKFDPAINSPENTVIAAILRAEVKGSRKATARGAMFAMSRMGYLPDTIALLQHSRSTGILSKNEYFGELAHLLIYAPSKAQVDIVEQVKLDKNAYASEILASSLSDPKRLEKLTPRAIELLHAHLLAVEPMFPMALSDFGVVDQLRYSNWLNALALTKMPSSVDSYFDTVLSNLDKEMIDPRKVLAYFNSPFGSKVVKDKRFRGRFLNAKNVATEYAESFPTHPIINEEYRQFAFSIGIGR